MTIFFHQLKRNKISLIIWSAVLSFMLFICIIIYPEMSSQMNEISDMFSNMGAFSDAFGMDSINFGEFMGYFGIECGNTLGLGGALFAALFGISALAKEEKEKTAEFLLTHPIKRSKVVFEKLVALIAQNMILFFCVTVFCTFSTLLIKEKLSLSFYLILISFLILQLEISFISFGISAFVKGGGYGIGIGISIGLYFINIISNLSDDLEFLKFITPFSYTDSGYITENNMLDFKYIFVGIIFSILSVAIAFYKYNKKDIQ